LQRHPACLAGIVVPMNASRGSNIALWSHSARLNGCELIPVNLRAGRNAIGAVFGTGRC
jgi:hypothetical protein